MRRGIALWATLALAVSAGPALAAAAAEASTLAAAEAASTSAAAAASTTAAAALPARWGSAVAGGFPPAPAAARSHWTRARREAAAAAPVATLAGSAPAATVAGSATGDPSYVPATAPHGEAPALRAAALAASVEGVDSGDPTSFPNSANGVVYGEYRTFYGSYAYRCSGSVVSSSAGNVVLTAGHCVVDPETGTVASYVVFVPGYREGSEPYGEWAATAYATTEAWARTAGEREPDEAGDLALLVLEDGGAGQSLQSEVGALGIAFDQAREATYTQYGYPAEEPYDGEVLYSHSAAYAGADASFSPPTMRIASDFTAGSSGGPWTVTADGAPVALSVTDYGYEEEPGHLYGPYLGSAARQAYELATGSASESEASVSGDSEAAPATASAASRPWLRLVSISRDRAAGTARLAVKVSGPGTLRLDGAAVRHRKRRASAATTLALTVRAKGRAARALRRDGSVAVGVRLSFSTASGAVRRSRLVRLALARAAADAGSRALSKPSGAAQESPGSGT